MHRYGPTPTQREYVAAQEVNASYWAPTSSAKPFENGWDESAPEARRDSACSLCFAALILVVELVRTCDNSYMLILEPVYFATVLDNHIKLWAEMDASQRAKNAKSGSMAMEAQPRL